MSLRTIVKGVVGAMVLLLVVQLEPAAEAASKRKQAKKRAGKQATSMAIKAAASQATGNGAKKGYRYTLNVIAFENCPDNPFVDSKRHMIAVKSNYGDEPQGKKPADISRINDILLKEGDFWVEDGNACDGSAIFHLPANPCADDDTEDGVCSSDNPTFQEYEVFLRLVGPHGGINATTCATDPAEEGACLDGLCADDSACVEDSDCDVIACSLENRTEVRTKGKKFQDVTKDLLTMVLDTDGDGLADTRIEIFNPALEDFFWNWNTNGKPHAQLFFIPFPD